jgi:quercetin dioxygenase-like cupin family protein
MMSGSNTAPELSMKLLLFVALVLSSLSLLAAQKPLKSQKSFENPPVPVEQEPHHHTVFKNDSILVMHVTIPAGDRTLYHIHAHDRVSVELSSSSISQQNLNEPEGPSTPTQPGDLSAPAVGAAPTIHRVHNFGPGTFEVLDIELLERPAQPSTAEAGPVAIENPSARVYLWALAPGASSTMHAHTRPYLIVAVNKMPLKMSAADGQSSAHEIQAGDFHWIDAKVRHSLTNEGSTEGQIVEIELK